MANSVVAFSPRYQKWYPRPKTTATVVYVGPSAVPNPPEFDPATDVRLYTDTPVASPAPDTYGGY